MGKTIKLKNDIKIDTQNIRASSVAGYRMDMYGNFHHLRNTASDEWEVYDSNENIRMKFIWETGVLMLGNRQVRGEVELFSGDTNDVTLSDSASNYAYLEIWYRSNDGSGHQGYTKVYAPQGKQFVLSYSYLSGYLYTKQSSFYIWNNTITQQWGVEWYFGNGVAPVLNNASNISITRVVGVL